MKKASKEQRGMEAVLEKVKNAGKPPARKALMRRKGAPAIAIMIAVGKPKPGMGKQGMDMPEGTAGPKNGKNAKRIKALEEQIAGLKAELALLTNEKPDEMDEEIDGEMEDEDEDED